MESKAGVFPWLKWLEMCFFLGTLLGTNISPEMAILKMIFLFQMWDMYGYGYGYVSWSSGMSNRITSFEIPLFLQGGPLPVIN